ncbi:molybdate ABC transporter substrate-binding protein [Tepidimonas taiwanensis]|uniref:molybdate ABC transporter substrate-binding protein n=1 Tax=Tepidimonas taiwanensis TaxID=307486 RepID=UPI0009E973A3|nr:molybdate ABC transporter substrate-binding protein [Tepidimonas taiwanensis]
MPRPPTVAAHDTQGASAPRRRLLQWALASAAGVGAARVGPAAARGEVTTVVAASDLKFALEELADTFQRASAHRLRLIFGSSGQFTTQILQGAPFHLFLSADEAFVTRLVQAGRTQGDGRLYAVGRIGLLVGAGGALQPDGTLRDLGAALRDGRLRKLAIAHPEHAPYGARAQEALQHAGLWQAVQPHLVLGENVAQAAQFVLTGGAQAGIVAQSLARAPAVAAVTRFALIDAAWHQPLRQRMVVLRGAPPAAHAFYEYLATPAAQAVLARYGFEAPR